jgi:LysR family pca operon transcriptional activator
MEIGRRHLEHLTAVALHRSVTKAAEALGITQPALSRSIHELEGLLGVRCFDRLSQGVVPTPACVALVERASAVLEGFEAFEGDAQRLGERFSGTLAVGVGPAVAEASVREIARFLVVHPDLRCRVAIDAPDALVQRLRSRELEFVVADHTALEDGACLFEAIEYDAILLCAPGHPLLRANHPAREITRYPVALLGPPATGLAAVRRFLREEDPSVADDWMPTLALDHAGALRELLLHGTFVGVSTPHAHATDLRAGTLRRIPLPSVLYRGRTGPVRLRDRTASPAADALWKAVGNALRVDVAAGAALLTGEDASDGEAAAALISGSSPRARRRGAGRGSRGG